MYLNVILALILLVISSTNECLALQTNLENASVEQEASSLNAFLNSDFVRVSVWPGIGPFQRAANSNRLVDPSGNQVTFSTLGNQISSCQLEMHGGSNEAQCMLNLQMGMDFLLEGLGLKPAQIHTINTEVIKNGKLLMGNNYNPIHTDVAPFIVSLQNLGITEGTDNSIYRIVVANKNLTSGNLETNKSNENNAVDIANTDESKTIETTAGSPVLKIAPSIEKTSQLAAANKNIDQSPEIVSKQVLDKTTDVNEETQISPTTVMETDNSSKDIVATDNKENKLEDSKPVVARKAISKDEELKNNFRDVIQNWQNLKKIAVKDLDTKLLSQALAGRALVRQTDNIKWLINNHKYYELTPGGAKIEKINALVANTKYAVFAAVKEKTKYVDQTTGQTIKDTDDTYKVNYTIEKIGGKWLITDSSLTKTTVEKNSDKPVVKINKTAIKTAH
jgi:hypothetical protein